jgi:hypothetical protein
MKYEIKKLYHDHTLEETATLDVARQRMAKLSKKFEVWLVAFSFERGKRVARSFAKEGRVYWAKECRDCGGTGRDDDNDKCGTCHGIGAMMDANSEAA